MVKKEEAIWTPKKVGLVFVSRRFTLRKGNTIKTAFLDIGRPVKNPNGKRSDPWICPIQIRGMGPVRFSYAAGIDGVQALTLALNLSMTLLPIYAEAQGYRIEFLDPRYPLIYDSWDLEDMKAARKRHDKKFQIENAELDKLFEKNRKPTKAKAANTKALKTRSGIE